MRPFPSLWLVTALCGLVFPMKIQAAEAAFTEDGKTVLACPHLEAKLWSVSLADGKTTVLDLKNTLEDAEDIVCLSRGPGGKFWVATSQKLFLWKPGEDTAQKVVALEEGGIQDINWNPVSGDLIVQTYSEDDAAAVSLLKSLPKDGKELVDAADAPDMLSASFDAEGRMFFSSDSDLWAGLASISDDTLTLSAWRAAPLSLLLYEDGNPGSSFTLIDVVPTGKSLIMTVSNEVEARLVQIPKPVVGMGPDGALEKVGPGLAAHWKQAAAALQSLKIVPIKDALAAIFTLCSSPDESQVFFTAHSDEDGKQTFRLLDVKTGKIRVLGEAPAEGEAPAPETKTN